MAVNVADLVATIRLDTSGIDRGIAAMQAKFGVMEQSVKGAGRALSGVQTPLSQITPALNNASQATQHATSSFASLGIGMTALVAGGMTALTMGLRAFISHIVEASKAQAAFNIAVRSADLGALRSQLQTISLDLEAFAVRTESVTGRIYNFFARGFGFLLGDPDPTIEAGRRLAAIGKFMEDFQQTLEGGRQAVAESAVGFERLSTALGGAAQNLDIAAFNAIAEQMRSIIGLQQEAADLTARAEYEIKRKAAVDRSAGTLELDLLKKSLDSQLALNAARAGISGASLGQRAQSGRQSMLDAINRPQVEAAQAIIDALEKEQLALVAIQDEAKKAADTLTNEGVRAQVEMAQATFDATEAMQLNLVAIQDREKADLDEMLKNERASWVDVADAIEQADFASASLAQTILPFSQEFPQAAAGLETVFGSLDRAISGTVDGVLQGTTTIQQGFANMGRNIAASLVENVIKRGLDVVQEALQNFIRNAEKQGLIAALLGLIGKSAVAAVSSNVGGLYPSAGPGYTSAGIPEAIGPTGYEFFQHGGMVNAPTRAIVGEGGPEAIIPLHGGAVPVAMSGGGVVINIINNAAGAEVGHEERRGADGNMIHDIVISSIKRGAARGELDDVFGGFGARRVGTQR